MFQIVYRITGQWQVNFFNNNSNLTFTKWQFGFFGVRTSSECYSDFSGQQIFGIKRQEWHNDLFVVKKREYANFKTGSVSGHNPFNRGTKFKWICLGWSLLWGQADVWVIFWIGMRTTPGILYCTPILLFRTKLNYFSGKTIQKYKSRGWFRYYGWPEQKQHLWNFLQYFCITIAIYLFCLNKIRFLVKSVYLIHGHLINNILFNENMPLNE